MQPRSPPLPGRRALLDGLLETVERLDCRRASEISEGYLEGYIALNWLKRDGDFLRLTTAGDLVRYQLIQGMFECQGAH